MEPLETPSPAPSSAFRPNRLTSGIVAGGAAFAMVLAGLGIASAQTDDSPTTPPPAASAETPEPGRQHGHHPGAKAELSTVAGVIGISEDDLRTQLRDGKTIAAIAGDKTDEVVAALVTEAEARLAQAVTDGKLTQAQADERKAGLNERITTMVNRTPPAGGRGHHHHPGAKAKLSTVAGVIGISEEELRTQLRDGKTIAAIAGDKTDEVVAALVTEAEARLAQAVTDGKLTQAQADERKAGLNERITTMVNRTPPAGGRGHHHHPGAKAKLSTVAGVIGISEEELRTQLRDGKTIAAIAGDKTDEVVAALVTEAEARLAQAVTDGKLTQAQADERKAGLQERITTMVNRTPPVGGPGHHHRGPQAEPASVDA